MEEKRVSSRKVRVGKVVSDKMDKTVVVAIEDRVAHPLYKKIVGRTYFSIFGCPLAICNSPGIIALWDMKSHTETEVLI